MRRGCASPPRPKAARVVAAHPSRRVRAGPEAQRSDRAAGSRRIPRALRRTLGVGSGESPCAATRADREWPGKRVPGAGRRVGPVPSIRTFATCAQRTPQLVPPACLRRRPAGVGSSRVRSGTPIPARSVPPCCRSGGRPHGSKRPRAQPLREPRGAASRLRSSRAWPRLRRFECARSARVVHRL